jgi:hypothetical protein
MLSILAAVGWVTAATLLFSVEALKLRAIDAEADAVNWKR